MLIMLSCLLNLGCEFRCAFTESRISINPESKSRQINREVLNELIKLHGKTALGGKLPAYDGRKSLYTSGSLPFESEEFAIKLVDPEKKEKERAEREYKITIRIAGRTDLYHLQQFLCGRQRDMPQETIQVLDVVLRESPSWNYVTVSRSFFSTTFGHRGDIGEGLECWRGYYQSLRPTQMGLSLNIDISATSFFKPVSVINFVEEFLNIRDTSRPLSDRDRVKIKKALRGVRIETTHQQDQIRRYKITGITPMSMSQLIFPINEAGTRQSVMQYFLDKYNYRLKYGSWPCLQAGSDSRPVYLPMEVCKIVEGQRYSKKLNDRQVTNILRATCKRPQEREQSIRDMVMHSKYAEDKFAQEFGISISNDLVNVPARVLPPPLLKYHESGREKTCAPSVGQWNMINKKMINGGTIDNWTCLNFSRMRPEDVHRFCMDLTHMCNVTGMVVNPHPFIEVKSAAPNHIEDALRDVHRRATQMISQQGSRNQLQLLIVILPDVSGSYGKIKKVCETDIGIVSQCCLPRHASSPNKQYLENVALKINVKVGGRNTVLERAFVRNGIPYVTDVPTIIFGADVTHPPPGEDSASSIAAVVASMDWPEITKYRGLVSAQPHRQEIIEDLFTVSKDPQKGHNVNGGMIRELLIAFRRKTNRKPERIIFYRDGVSEGQFSHVLLHEMDAIRKACASLEEGYLPPVTFVVVQKRHHTRLFPEVHGRRDMTDKSGNILPGTVVDQKICHPTEFDFYLCSHAGIQGTSRPTHYHVLYDENNFDADALQSLMNNLCYTYARCTHAVSVVLERAFVRNGIPCVTDVPTIIFGADVTHPPPGEDSASSIAAVVASMDWPEITKYRGLVSAQPHRQEIIEDLFTVSKDSQKGQDVNGGTIRCVRITVTFCGQNFHQMVKTGTIIDVVISSLLEKLDLKEDDCWFMHDWLETKMKYPEGFFEYIWVPPSLRAGYSFDGFTINDIYYIPEVDSVMIHRPAVSYDKDLYSVKHEVIKRFLRFENAKGELEYPIPDFLGRLDYSRCLLTHGKKSTLVIEAALYLLWQDQLPELQKKIIIDYVSSVNEPEWHGLFHKPVYEDNLIVTEIFEERTMYAHGRTGYVEWYAIPETTDLALYDIFL
ncbi:hypothetical protein U9M48_010848 [Paspalum notatum var. saurae]|uniref:Uncharacterized protein n=1 Tax=Paspalum notatum var. saurae TaxID=547442 RepID=A0AAQ3STX0_PASNO